jgi:hypothetical protein
VEFGAGTGKATTLFAEAGVAVTGLEPDSRMAEVLRCNTVGYPAVEIEVTSFEAWTPGDRRFADGARGDVVALGGPVARLGPGRGHTHTGRGGDTVLEPARRARPGPAHRTRPHRRPPRHPRLTALPPASAYGPSPGDWSEEHWPAPDRRRFGDFRLREEIRYDTDRYLEFLDSVSTYHLLPDDHRNRALAETADLLNRRGGGIDMLHLTDLFLARRTAAAASAPATC